MDISKFQQLNEIRADRWHKGGDWTLLEWAGAMCGEAGEAANVAKKIKRIQTNLPNLEAGLPVEDYGRLERKLAEECADVIIYALIIMSRLNADASSTIAYVFNKKSEEYGFPERA
jgi:NTP pyrophosphatase (non-canonical NTP hydrolase)